MNKDNSYKQIVKATGIFGGVQVFNIVISITKSKIIAILMGATGIGLMGLISNTINIIATVTNLGMSSSAVRTVAVENTKKDKIGLNFIIKNLKRWFFFSSLVGLIFVLIMSAHLSIWVFNKIEFTIPIMWLSLAVFFQTLNNGQLAIIQGLHNLKNLAKANVLGSFFGLLFSIPFYYLYGIKGIVPAFIISTICGFFWSYYYITKLKLMKLKISIKETIISGFDTIKLGGVIMITNFLLIGVFYLIQLYILKSGGIENVGLYLAANTIINGYIGIIFSTLQPDFLPRLSAQSNNNDNTVSLVNQEGEMLLLLLGPLLILLLSTLPIIINILFTSKFLSIIPLIRWAVLGVLFKASYWTIGTMLIAKGDFKLFFRIEMLIDIIILFTNILLYKLLQLEGIGIAYLITNLIGMVVYLLLVYKKYNFKYNFAFQKIIKVQFLLIVITFIVIYLMKFYMSFLLTIPLSLLSFLFSYIELKKRINLDQYYMRIKTSLITFKVFKS